MLRKILKMFHKLLKMFPKRLMMFRKTLKVMEICFQIIWNKVLKNYKKMVSADIKTDVKQ